MPARSHAGRRRHAAQHRAGARGSGHIQLDGQYFQAVDESRRSRSRPRGLAKPDDVHVLMHVARRRPLHQLLRRPASVLLRQRGEGDGRAPSRAIRWSAGMLARAPRVGADAGGADRARSTTSCAPRVHAVNRLTPTIVEVVVHAPAAARAFQPGQFYRLQNYETLAASASTAPRLAMEGLALTGAWTDRTRAWSRSSCWRWAARPISARC